MWSEEQEVVKGMFVKVHVEVFENVNKIEWQPAHTEYSDLRIINGMT